MELGIQATKQELDLFGVACTEFQYDKGNDTFWIEHKYTSSGHSENANPTTHYI